jgi:hypothetical protein
LKVPGSHRRRLRRSPQTVASELAALEHLAPSPAACATSCRSAYQILGGQRQGEGGIDARPSSQLDLFQSSRRLASGRAGMSLRGRWQIVETPDYDMGDPPISSSARPAESSSWAASPAPSTVPARPMPSSSPGRAMTRWSRRVVPAGPIDKLTGRSKVKYPSTMAMTSRSSPAAQLLQQPAKGQEWSVQGSWHANPRLFVLGRTVASTLAPRGLPMSPRHWCYTERAARTSSTTPTPVISSHNTCGQLSGLKFPASGWSWPS